MSTLRRMEVILTPDKRALIRQAIATGRLQHEEEAVREALSLWEERERKRVEFLASLEDAKASTARGEGRVNTKRSRQELSEEVKQRGRDSLTAVQKAQH